MSERKQFISIEGDAQGNIELVIEGGIRIPLNRDEARNLARWIKNYLELTQGNQHG